VYSGGVTVTELGRDAAKGTPMVMACEELTVRTLPGGGLESILAEQTVQITQGDNVVSGSRAVYAASNDVVQVSGFARWRTPQAEGEGNVLVLDRQRDQFRARGDTRTRLLGKAGEGMLTVPLEGKKDPIATNEVTEIFADQLQVGLPMAGQPVSSMIAEHRVRINYGANRAEGDRAVYLLTNGLPVVRLDGHGHWRTPEAEGRADTLVFNRAAGEFKGEGNGWLKLARPGAPKAGLPAASVPTALEVTASNYFLRGPAAEFTGGVKVADAAWNLACDRMQLALGANNRVKSIRALQGVIVGQSPAAPAGGTRLESRLRCEELDATMSATGQQMEKVNARNQVTVEQWATPAGGARNLQWTLTAQAAELLMVPGGQTVKTITASGQVQVRQMGLNALGLPVPTWTLGCVNLGLAMAEGGTRVQKAAARKEVVIEQGLVSGTNQAGPWKIRCEEMDLRMAAATNQLEHVTAHTGVIIDQAGSQARAETAEFNNLTQRVELTGHPWLRVLETKGKSGKEPQALEIRNAEVLIWDRQSNRFSGRGPFQIESLSPLPSLEPPSKP
jgi:lipopolysaccharide export system protein LptA